MLSDIPRVSGLGPRDEPMDIQLVLNSLEILLTLSALDMLLVVADDRLCKLGEVRPRPYQNTRGVNIRSTRNYAISYLECSSGHRSRQWRNSCSVIRLFGW